MVQISMQNSWEKWFSQGGFHGTPPWAPTGPYFLIKVKIFLKSGFKMNWSSYVLANSLNFEFLLTLMQILFTIS